MESQFIELQAHIDGLFKSADEGYYKVAKAQGISPSTQDILYCLSVYGDELTQKQICDYSYSSKQTINSSIRKLEQQGILQMRAGHGREKLVSLTDAGLALAQKAVAPIVTAEQHALESIPESQREQFFELMDVYATTLVSRLDEAAKAATEDEGNGHVDRN